ncbi:GerAB/ArcD/ProY family transporter [Bacillus sp. FJAT-29937]|uniref:GerAB/ArcD/ProY family transporter n=1 Tax=Bacillus sp. FJAT-29937 TaxID=1720553 RepID=UPI000833112F|nr:endospore germination permease [Bacillus sp. FJAT-29937]
MDQSKGQIGIRELFAIIILTVGTKLSDDTPTIFFKHLNTAAWMAPLIIGAVSFLPLLLLHKTLDLYGDKNLAEIILDIFGKYIGFFILLFLFAISFSALSVDSAIYGNLVSSMYFTKTPYIVIHGLSMALCVYGAKKGISNIGSVAWAFLLYIKLTLLIVILLLFVKGETNFLFPLFGPGKWEIIKKSVTHTSVFADLFYMALLFPFLKDKENYKKGIWIGLLFVMIEMSASIIGYIMLFDYVGAKTMNYPFHEAIRYFQIGFLINVEIFFFPFWLVAAFMRFTIYLYINALLFSHIFKIKDINYFIPIMTALAIVLGLIPDSPSFSLIHLREHIIYLTTPVFLIFPIVIWLFGKIKGVKNNESVSN